MEMQRGDPGRAPRRKLGTQAAFPPGGEAHPPEDGRELHAAPELREVLEAHAVHLLEAAEQRLAVGLQARRDPHAFKRPRAHGTGRSVRRGPHVPSRLANSSHQEPGPAVPPQLRHAGALRDVLSATSSPASIRAFPCSCRPCRACVTTRRCLLTSAI